MAKPNRATLLFYYDSKMANPNGDPTTNLPRMIDDTCFVTSNRLKRTIRDHLRHNMKEAIYIVPEYKKDGFQKTPEELGKAWLKKKGKKLEVNKKGFLDHFIDLRLFGLMYVIPNLVNPFKFVGPVQFGFGESLNKVEPITVEITRIVTVGKEKAGGAMGEHTVLKYAFIEFLGTINPAAIIEENNITEEDVEKMLKGLWLGTNGLKTTSKDQASRLLLKINVKDDILLSDLDHVNTLVGEKKDEKLRTINDVVLDVEKSFNQFETFASSINSIEYMAHPLLVCRYKENTGNFNDIINDWASNANITIKQLNL